MGKRELLLVVVFVAFGVLVYQVTKPAGDPNKPGWSFGGIVEQMRREVRGNQARAEVTKTERIAAPATLKEIKIDNQPEITIVGEDRDDIELELKIVSRAYDDAEAKRTAEATVMAADQAGELLTLTAQYPREGQQTAVVTLRVPRRLAIRIDEKSRRLQVSNVAGVMLGGAGRGEATITDISGPVQAVQRGSAITINNVGTLKLTTFNSGEVKVSNVHGNASFTFQGGEVRAESLEGTIEVESRNADIKFDKLEKARAPIRINAVGGEVVLNGVQVETRVDARRAEVRVDQTAAAPLAIYSEGELIEVSLPAAGFTLDAMATAGRVSVDKPLEAAGIKITDAQSPQGSDAPRESRAAGNVKNGGPSVTLRSTRGEIVLRSRN